MAREQERPRYSVEDDLEQARHTEDGVRDNRCRKRNVSVGKSTISHDGNRKDLTQEIRGHQRIVVEVPYRDCIYCGIAKVQIVQLGSLSEPLRKKTPTIAF